jgi:hypothetical protein
VLEVAKKVVVLNSSGAERMRLHRERRRLGLGCIVVESRKPDDLVRKGLLKEDARDDVHAVRQALCRHLDATLNQHSR